MFLWDHHRSKRNYCFVGLTHAKTTQSTAFKKRYSRSTYGESSLVSVRSPGRAGGGGGGGGGTWVLNLLPSGSEEREVLGVGSIPVAILPFCQDMKTIAL